MSGVLSARSSAARARIPARSLAAIRGHGPSVKARDAASTARSTSAWVATGTDPTASSVEGDTTVSVSSPHGATQAPPM